ncbi:MAG TPA: hypothetical protein VK671_04705 [Mucilaginibacter sp.]|jgi:hypothetical protein|nr:hypothetical protein [Mucilaginibacter sp.]
MENRFTALEIVAYKKKVDLILSEIKLYRDNLKNSKDYNFSQSGLEEYQLDKLEQAFKDLGNFYEDGKKAWFRIYKDITQNYRFGQGLNGVWIKIAPLYDSFWLDLTLPEKMFIAMSTFKFRLPNLKNKSYTPFEEKLNSDFAAQLKKLDASYVLEVDKTADTYGIRIRVVSLPVMYTIVCTISKVEVTINPNARKEIRPEITELLFNFITDYLEI